MVVGVVLGVVLVACISAATNEDSVGEKQVDGTENETQSDYQKFINDNYKVFAMPFPANVSFSGESVPVENILVHDALDKEIHANTYWHSNTFFYIKRAYRWFPVIEPILSKNGVPDDFKYLAVIESGLLNATSPSGAKGFWQFMKKTAEGYSLEINDDVDERYHLVKSTEAACEYLKNSYDKFGNWTLAAASYNMGKAGVLGQLSKQKADNYYDLLLNSETARYIYRIVAVKCILENPENYGFNLTDEDYYHPYKVEYISVDSTVNNLVDFAHTIGTNYKTLKALNPWLISNELKNSSNKVYEIAIPQAESGLDVIGEFSTKYVNE